jgi:hypothetical protein
MAPNEANAARRRASIANGFESRSREPSCWILCAATSPTHRITTPVPTRVVVGCASFIAA